jgi:SAM-dependent methyltransferase
MRLHAMRAATVDGHFVDDPLNVGLDYDRAGERYITYADGHVDKLYDFDSQYSYGDAEIWKIIDNTLKRILLTGSRELSVLDLGCGPGTWLRRIVHRASLMGFTRITARGLDLAETQVKRARVLSRTLAHREGVSLQFEARDILHRLPEADRSIDICLCLYAVLNHLDPKDIPGLFSEIARVTKGSLLATIRAIGSRPTIYVDSVKAARAYHQDNVRGRLGVEFQDGSQTCMPSHLLSAAQLRSLVQPALEIDELSGLDLFHGRFASDPDWNPAEVGRDARFAEALRALEQRFRRDATFVDHATHLLLIARPRRT